MEIERTTRDAGLLDDVLDAEPALTVRQERLDRGFQHGVKIGLAAGCPLALGG
jgi:hypothetical protein